MMEAKVMVKYFARQETCQFWVNYSLELNLVYLEIKIYFVSSIAC